MPPSMGVPGGGGGGAGGGGPLPWATHTKLINTNKIEAICLLFCIIIWVTKLKKKGVTNKILRFSRKNTYKTLQNIDEMRLILLCWLIRKRGFYYKSMWVSKIIP